MFSITIKSNKTDLVASNNYIFHKNCLLYVLCLVLRRYWIYSIKNGLKPKRTISDHAIKDCCKQMKIPGNRPMGYLIGVRNPCRGIYRDTRKTHDMDHYIYLLYLSWIRLKDGKKERSSDLNLRSLITGLLTFGDGLSMNYLSISSHYTRNENIIITSGISLSIGIPNNEMYYRQTCKMKTFQMGRDNRISNNININKRPELDR